MRTELDNNLASNTDNQDWRPSNVRPLLKVISDGSSLSQGVPLMDRTIFAFSNTELKPAIMLYGINDDPAHTTTIARRLSVILPDSWAKPQEVNMGRLARTFMAPPGFVDEPIQNYFSTTQEGQNIAKDTAAFLLSKAVELATPLGPILSEVDKSKEGETPTRAYITRIASLLALRNGPLSQIELRDLMDEEVSSLKWNLGVLSSRKLLSYDSINPEVKGEFVYKRTNIDHIPEGLNPTIQNIIKYFRDNELGNNYAIAKAVGGKSVQYIGRLLRQLSDNGVVEPVKWEQGLQSEAKITELGERVVDELIIPLLSAYSGDEDSQKILRETRNELEYNSVVATAALDQYKKQRVLIPEPVTQRTIVDMVRSRGSLRRKEIIAEMGYKAHPQIRELVANGELKIVRDGSASFYVLPESEEKPKRPEEMVIFSFNPPEDLIDSIQFRKRDEYRRDLDTIQFWNSIKSSLESIKPDRYTARDFFLKYDPEHKDWSRRWDSGIFSGHIRALRSLGVDSPWEFIRTYNAESVTSELQEIIKTTQELMDKVVPVESTERTFNRRYIDPLETPDFWQELATDFSSVPQNTKFESFLFRFDPNVEGKMKPGHTYGKYYPLLCNIRDHLNQRVDVFLTGYRPPEGTQPETSLIIRKTQAALRAHLRLKNIPDDDFSDIPALENELAAKEQERQLLKDRHQGLTKQFERFSRFNEAEIASLAQCDARRIQYLQTRIKGEDFEDASFPRMGIDNVRREGAREIYVPFPAEPRASFLIYLFEFWRRGDPLPAIPEEYDDFILSNGVVRSSLRTTEQYLNHYEAQLRKQDPNIHLTLDKLLGYVMSYLKRNTE